MAGKNPLAPEVLFEHVQDAPYFHLPRMFTDEASQGHLYLPQPLATPIEGSDHGHGPNTSRSSSSRRVLPSSTSRAADELGADQIHGVGNAGRDNQPSPVRLARR